MARKKQFNRRGGAAMLERIGRLLSRGKAKQALKDAKACYRGEPTAEHRQLLEKAYLQRIKELVRMELRDQARRLLDELVELGITEPAVQQELPRLRLAVEDASAAAAVLADHPELLATAVDMAVVDGQRARLPDQQLQQQVTAVREALQLIEHGDDEAAATKLQGIPRQSPLADWRLFARGLIAFYSGQLERARENWQRLSPQRRPHRIARVLLIVVGDEQPAEVEEDLQGPLELLRRHQVHPVIAPLEKLAAVARTGNDRELMRQLRQIRRQFGKSHPEVLSRLADLLWGRIVREGRSRQLEQLIKEMPGPALDPRWNRARALMAEHPPQENHAEAERYWLDYVKDLDSVTTLSAGQRSTAKGLVFIHIAERLLAEAGEMEKIYRCQLPWEQSDGARAEAIQQRRRSATYYCRSAAECDPRLVQAYHLGAAAHLALDEHEEAAELHEELLQQKPEDVRALREVILLWHSLERPERAERYAQLASQLWPRDPEMAILRGHQHLLMSRACARQKMFEAARRELEQAEPLLDSPQARLVLAAHRAGIEYRAGRTSEAERHVARGQSLLADPAPFWLAMSMTAAKLQLGSKQKGIFDQRLKDGLRQRGRSATAGVLAALICSWRMARKKYRGQVTHEKLVCSYLSRCKNIRWQAADLRKVCKLLGTMENKRRLMRQLLTRNIHRFQNDPFIQYWYAISQLNDGGDSWYALTLAKQHLKQAIELFANVDDLERKYYEEAAKERLAAIEQVLNTDMPMPFDWDEDEEEEDVPFFSGPPPGDWFELGQRQLDLDTLRALIRMMPPPLRALLQGMAALSGRTMEKELEEILACTTAGEFDDEDPEPPPRSRKKKRKGKRARWW